MKRIPKSVLSSEEPPLRSVSPETWVPDDVERYGEDLFLTLLSGAVFVAIGLIALFLARFVS